MLSFKDLKELRAESMYPPVPVTQKPSPGALYHGLPIEKGIVSPGSSIESLCDAVLQGTHFKTWGSGSMRSNILRFYKIFQDEGSHELSMKKKSVLSVREYKLRNFPNENLLFSIYGFLSNTTICNLLLWSIFVAVCAVRVS